MRWLWKATNWCCVWSNPLESGAGKITSRWPLNAVQETDLAGTAIGTPVHDDTGFSFAIAPFEIKTFRIELK